MTLESTYRHTLELNTTYLVGKTREGHMILLPKHLIEHANLITFLDQDVLRKQQQHNNRLPPIEYSDVSTTTTMMMILDMLHVESTRRELLTPLKATLSHV